MIGVQSKCLPGRVLLLVLLLPLLAASAYSQSATATPTATPTLTNPDKAPCGLPKWGRIVKTVTYELKADCAQDYFLEIETAKIPDEPLTLTIDGNGHTITYAKGLSARYNFLVVDDEGISTPQGIDTPLSPHIKVIIRDVTFDGGDVRFGPLPIKTFGGPRGSMGPWILVDGALEMENVTFTRGNGIWVWAKGTASLKNVLFQDSWITRFAYNSSVKGMLYVAKSASVTLDKAVFRDIGRSVIMIDKGGNLSTKGCLSFIRVWTHKVHHSGVWDGFGTWSDKSTGPCASGTIGNKGKAVVAYTLPMLDCGLPSSGTIEGTVVYTLTQPCVCVSTVNIAVGARVTINANGNRIEGCSTGVGYGQFRVGNAHLTINNANLYNMRVRNYGGQVTLANSIVRNAVKVPIVNYGWVYLLDSRFENNRGDSDSNVYYSHGHLGLGRALFRDNVFRNNGPGDIEAYTTGRTTAIYLCGDNILDGAVPTSVASFFMAVDGGAILGCPTESSAPSASSEECLPEAIEPPNRMGLGAIGVIFFLQKCPPVIEIWEVLPNSQGQFALRVRQSDVDGVQEGVVACSSNGRAAVRVGLTEPVRQKIVHSRAYQTVSPRQARDIQISVGPNPEGKVIHIVTDNVLDGQVLGTVDTRSEERPCQGVNLSDLLAAAAATPEPTPIPFAAAVSPQPARADGSIVHIVRPGDTIWQIGIAYDVHPFIIISLNELDQLRNRGRYIFPGQELVIREAG